MKGLSEGLRPTRVKRQGAARYVIALLPRDGA